MAKRRRKLRDIIFMVVPELRVTVVNGDVLEPVQWIERQRNKFYFRYYGG